MTSNALNIYKGTLDFQLGEDSPITEQAIYDPSGLEVILYGVFEANTYRGDKDGGNVTQKLLAVRFLLSSPLTFDIEDDKQIYFPHRDRMYTIQYQDTDDNGVQVLWVF